MRSAAVTLMIAVCLWAGANLWLAPPQQSDPVALFMDEAGESWFGAYLGDRKIGYARFAAERTNAFGVSSTLTLRLPNGSWYHVEEHKRFDIAPPYPLRRFERLERTDASEQRLLLESNGAGGYRAVITQPDGTRTLPVELQYALADHVGLRGWLESNPPIGSIHELRDIDVDRLLPLSTRWRLVAADEGFVLEGIGEGIDRRTVFDPERRLVELEIGGGLKLHREPRALAMLLGPGTPREAHNPKLDRPIGRARNVRRLVLELNAAAAAVFGAAPGQRVETTGTGVRLVLDPSDPALNLAAHDPGRALAESVAYPKTPQVDALAQRAVADAHTDRVRAMRLTRFVHEFIAYSDTGSALTVDDIIRRRSGDCTEYAELFTALARTLNLPARTVSGLVYRDAVGDRLALHAWNEVVLDGKWFPVDPTWNQFGIDATHLRFPLEPDLQMRAHTLLPEMSFKVISVDAG